MKMYHKHWYFIGKDKESYYIGQGSYFGRSIVERCLSFDEVVMAYRYYRGIMTCE